jgi:N-formylglutamate amidohydrolase
LAEAFFRAQGFVVGVDIPFSGAIVPNRFFDTEPRVQSLMIEVRRDLYMDESTSARHDGFARIQTVLTEFRTELARFATT